MCIAQSGLQHFNRYYGQRDENGKNFNDESEVLCERFEVVYPKPPAN